MNDDKEHIETYQISLETYILTCVEVADKLLLGVCHLEFTVQSY